MKLKGIITNRKVDAWPSFDLIYEWEDCLAKELRIPLVDSFRYKEHLRNLLVKYRLVKGYQRVKKLFFRSRNYYLYFLLGVTDHSKPPLFTRRKVIPVIVDFFVSPSGLSHFYANYREYDLVLVSDRDAYHFLQQNNPPFRIAHFPLSLPDIYKLTAGTHFDKKYDLLLAGRENPVLAGFLETYIAKHPDFEYIFRKFEDGRFNYYSNQTGLIGEFGTREEFLKLIRAARCAFYSTPGIDGDESRTNGFSPVTPRFFEFLAAQCLVIARYPENEDTDFFEVASITPNINSYEAFEKTLNHYLALTETPSGYILYLSGHYTSERAKLLKVIS
jgi:hypothetical protein